jgi:alpha-beta hydrolase superfamily lysophospholipase
MDTDRPRVVTRPRLVAIARIAVLGLFTLGGALLAIAFGDVMYSSTLAPLRPWHVERLEHEFEADQAHAGYRFDDYLAQEQRLFDEVQALRVAHYDPALDAAISRYAPDRGPYAKRVDRDWNRSYRLPASPQRGVALLVHGLSDSPYALRSVAEALHAAGVTVYGLRLPGHGTLPSGLDHALWEDWLAAVGLTVRQIRRDHPQTPFWYVGFSTGATLGLKHSVDAIAAGREDLLPRRLFLLSPAMGVSPFAHLANVQRLISRWGVAPKARWTDIGPEIDPYKYTSFAKNAGAQIAALIDSLYRDLDRMDRDGSIARLPPVTGFQSIVDATVSTPDLAGRFYGRLRGGASELVLFDVNRQAGLEALLAFSPAAVIAAFEGAPRRDYRLTVLHNAGSRPTLTESVLAPGATQPLERALDLAWPQGVVSLSHVALPFAPDDPIYGLAAPAHDGLVSLGALALRGERGVLAIPPAEQLRLRSNPFFGYVTARILGVIEESAAR